MRHSRFLLAAVLLAGLAPLSAAAEQTISPDEAVKMRQGVLTAMKWEFAPIVAVAKGEAPFSEEVVKHARNLTALARIAPTGFIPGSGVDVVRSSRAKPTIWKSTEKFSAGWNSLVTETERLAIVAQNRDAGALKVQVGAIANVCKDCHDAFRAE